VRGAQKKASARSQGQRSSTVWRLCVLPGESALGSRPDDEPAPLDKRCEDHAHNSLIRPYESGSLTRILGYDPADPSRRARKNAPTLRPKAAARARESVMTSVREALEGFELIAFWFEQSLGGVVYEAEEHAQSFFQVGERGGMLWLGHLLLALW
jgi:hypothetical protein